MKQAILTKNNIKKRKKRMNSQHFTTEVFYLKLKIFAKKILLFVPFNDLLLTHLKKKHKMSSCKFTGEQSTQTQAFDRHVSYRRIFILYSWQNLIIQEKKELAYSCSQIEMELLFVQKQTKKCHHQCLNQGGESSIESTCGHTLQHLRCNGQTLQQGNWIILTNDTIKNVLNSTGRDKIFKAGLALSQVKYHGSLQVW